MLTGSYCPRHIIGEMLLVLVLGVCYFDYNIYIEVIYF